MKRIDVLTSDKMYMFTLFKSRCWYLCVHSHSLQTLETFAKKKKKKHPDGHDVDSCRSASAERRSALFKRAALRREWTRQQENSPFLSHFLTLFYQWNFQKSWSWMLKVGINWIRVLLGKSWGCQTSVRQNSLWFKIQKQWNQIYNIFPLNWKIYIYILFWEDQLTHFFKKCVKSPFCFVFFNFKFHFKGIFHQKKSLWCSALKFRFNLCRDS